MKELRNDPNIDKSEGMIGHALVENTRASLDDAVREVTKEL